MGLRAECGDLNLACRWVGCYMDCFVFYLICRCCALLRFGGCLERASERDLGRRWDELQAEIWMMAKSRVCRMYTSNLPYECNVLCGRTSGRRPCSCEEAQFHAIAVHEVQLLCICIS